jgi:hypothetical protein
MEELEYSVYLNKGYQAINKSTTYLLPGSPSILFVNQLEYIEINSSDFKMADNGHIIMGVPKILGVSLIYLPTGLTQLTSTKWGGGIR